MAQWNGGPSVSPNEWHCFEVDLLGDLPQHDIVLSTQAIGCP
jgi:hypothetical protein